MQLKKLSEVLAEQPKYRFAQALKAIYRDLIGSWQEATILPKDLREKLEQECPLGINYELDKGKSSDKALITLKDDSMIEAVLMRHRDGRNTVCVSVQVGCPIGCIFCATGRMGLKRNLKAQEMVEQVLLFARLLKAEGQKVTNVVYMGMGEPFLNYEEVIESIEILHDPEKFGLGARHFSISTSGVVPGIKRLAKEDLEINLAISLHAADDELRSGLMPINKTYKLHEMLEAVDYYIETTRRKVMFEYIMIDGINDTSNDARKLAALVQGKLAVVNLIPYNGKQFKTSTKQRLDSFKKILEALRINVIQRSGFGREIEGACGQLAAKRAKK